MPRRVAEVGEGHEDGNGVYGIIRDLIVEGKDARFVNKKGRYVVNWSRALDCFTDYKAKKNPQFKSKAVSRRKISNGLRSALLNYYKKEGAKEYKDAKKVNENDEVVERQFQMPPRLFKSMFREAGPTITEDSEEDDQEDTSSLLSSEGDDKLEVSLSTSTSDTGFDEFMDMSSHEIVEPLESSLSVAGNFLTDLGLDVIKTEGEETSVDLSDVQLPPASQMFDPSMLDSAIEEICSDGISDDISDEGIDLLGVVQDICPTSGSIKGGFQFYLSLTEELPDEVKTGVAQFERVANVMVYKLNPFTLTGTVPSSQVPGEVAVTVVTDAGKKLGMTCFRYIDEMREMVRQIVKDPTLQSLWFAMWSQEHGFFGNDSNIAQVLGPIDLQGQVQTKQQQSVKVLQLLVYTAAQTDAREFIEMVFGTSAGQIVFNSYKDRTPLPEDVALANGHEELAQYLTDINTRLSKETFEDVQSCAIDWLELVKAVQKQSSQDESTKGLQQPSDIDDTSDYFADVETSSCGSSDHDIVWTNMSENKTAWKCPRGSPILQEPCTDEDILSDVHPVETTISENGPSNKCPLKATNSDEKLKKSEESTQRPTARPVVDKKGTPSKHEAQLENENEKEGVTYGCSAYTFDCISKWWKKKDSGTMAMEQDKCLDEKEKELPSKSRSLFQGLFWRGSENSEANVHSASGPHMTKPKECHKRPGRATGRSTRKKEAGLNYKGVVLTFALLTVLAGFKLKEGQILHWAVGNGYTQFSKMLLQCGVYVDVPGLLKETPLHLAAKNGFRDLVDVLVQSGGNVNARNFPMQETPLHLATRNGHHFIAQFLVQQGSQVNARNVPWQETPLHLATRNGHRHIVQFLVQQGSQVNTRNVPSRETPLHLASRNGHQQIAEFLIHHGSQVNARNVPWQETPLHLAARNGHRYIAQFLVQRGSQVNARNVPSREMPLHLASRNGHQQIAEFLIHHGSQVNARNVPWQETPLHWALKNGHRQIAKFLKQHGGLAYTLAALTLSSRNGHQQIEFVILHRGFFVATNISWQGTPFAEFLMQHGTQVNCNIPVQETQGTQNGRQQIAESLVRQECSANNSNVPLQETSLHRAEKNGHQPAVEFFILKRSQDDARNAMRETPPHLVSQNGYHANQTAVPLCRNGGQVHARKVETPFHWARKSGPRHTSQFFTQPNDISSRRNENYLPSQLVARNGQHRGLVNAKNSSLQTNFLNLASRTGRRQIAESSIRRGIEIIAKDIQRQETSFIQQGSGINARVCEKGVSLHWAARNEIKRCRQKSSPELVGRRLSQVSASSVLCHWLKKYSATSDFRLSARRKIPRLGFTRGGGLCNCLNEIDQTKSPIFTERHQHASLGAKDLVDQSLVQSQMSTRKEKLLTHAFGSSSDRKTSQELSWYTNLLCVVGKCGKDGVNWVLTNNFSVIIGCCVALCFVFVALSLWFFWRNKQTVYFARHCSILPFLDYTSESEVKCIRTIELIESKEGDKCVKEAADNGALGDKRCTQTISTKNSASELFERKFFPEVLAFSYQQLDKDESVRRLRMERVRKWLECNHDQDVLSSVESEVELSPTMSRFSSSTMVKELTIDETVNIQMPESADTVPSMKQSHAVTGSVQGTYTAVSCIPCGHGDYACQRCEKCSSCGNMDVLLTCSINRDAVCSKSCKSKTHYFNESDGQCYPCTEYCGKDKTNIEPVLLKRKEKDSGAKQVASMAQSDAVAGSVQQTLRPNADEPVPLKRKKRDSGAPAGKSVVVLKSSNVTVRNDSVFMPNTIEMAKLKKKEKGQFLTNVPISSKMSQQDIRELLISLFPYLGDQRFYCASAEDDRTRLDFHGERRIWDGRLIKQKIKGNSDLYIFTDEGSLRRQDSSTHSKQPTLDEILVGNGAATRVQEGITCNSAAQSKRGSVVNTVVERLNCLFAGIVSNATDAHNHEDAGMSRSDYEEVNRFLTSLFQDEMDLFKPGCVDSHLQASEEEADENKEGRFSRFLSDHLDVLYVAREEDYSGFTAWSPSEDYDLEVFRDLSFAGHPGGQDGPGRDKFLLSEESTQRLRHVTLKDPKRKSLRRRGPRVCTHETMCRYVIVTDTTASDYLDTLSRITTGTWCESGDFAKPSRYPCNRSTNVDEGLYRRWSPCKDGTSNRPSLVKTAEKADQHSSASTKLKKSANEIGAERGSCRRVDAQVYEIRSPTPFVPCILRDKENCQ